MESVAAAWTRLHFQSFGMTVGLHDRKTKARLVHVFYWSSGVDYITENKVSKKRLCENKQNFPGFIVLSQKIKKGLCHWIACLSAYIGPIHDN